MTACFHDRYVKCSGRTEKTQNKTGRYQRWARAGELAGEGKGGKPMTADPPCVLLPWQQVCCWLFWERKSEICRVFVELPRGWLTAGCSADFFLGPSKSLKL